MITLFYLLLRQDCELFKIFRPTRKISPNFCVRTIETNFKNCNDDTLNVLPFL
jgi:hypothetical protein